jgi:NAD-dependent dihydropyrimidine dehydrogenase PreA subunit
MTRILASLALAALAAQALSAQAALGADQVMEKVFNAPKSKGTVENLSMVVTKNGQRLTRSITNWSAGDHMKGEVEKTIAVNKDYCILCGACVNACPGEDIIVLQRTGIRMKGTETDLFKKIKAKLFATRTSKVKESTSGQVELKGATMGKA